MSGREQRERAFGAYGDSRDMLEQAALDEARLFFGAEAQLEIVRGYMMSTWPGDEPGRRYWAMVTVREVI